MNRKTKYWSSEVTRTSNALMLEPGVFTWKSPKKIARSLKRSADESINRKGTSHQSAMSMLNFYINRAGSNLSDERKKVLNQAKNELRTMYNEEQSGGDRSYLTTYKLNKARYNELKKISD